MAAEGTPATSTVRSGEPHRQRLSGPQVKQLHARLLLRYPRTEELTRVVRFELDVRMEEITSGPTLGDRVFQLIEWAEANARIRELIGLAGGGEAATNTATSRIRIELDGTFSEFGPADQRRLLECLEQMTGFSMDRFIVERVQEGSVKVTVLMPAPAADRLLSEWEGESADSRTHLKRNGVVQIEKSPRDLSNAEFEGADLTGANLANVDLTGANLAGANLTASDLTGANLTRAILTAANLTDANLTSANLTSANLTGAIVTGANFTDALVPPGITQRVAGFTIFVSLLCSLFAFQMVFATQDVNLFTNRLVVIPLLPHVELHTGSAYSLTPLLLLGLQFLLVVFHLTIPAQLPQTWPGNLWYWPRRGHDLATCPISLALVAIWARYQVAHQPLVSNLQIICLILAVFCSTAFYTPILFRNRAIIQANIKSNSSLRLLAAVHAAVLVTIPVRLKWGAGAGANLVGANLTGTNLVRANLVGANLAKANLTGAHLGGAKLSDVYLHGANLVRADLSSADLTAAQLSEADLSGATLRRAILTRAQLSDAHLPEADLREGDFTAANLKGADFRKADLRMADLRRAALQQALLLSTKLDEANLEDADLRKADLAGAYLLGTRLRGANLEGARLRWAFIMGANFRGARYGATTTWPIGFNPRAEGAIYVNSRDARIPGSRDRQLVGWEHP